MKHRIGSVRYAKCFTLQALATCLRNWGSLSFADCVFADAIGGGKTSYVEDCGISCTLGAV